MISSNLALSAVRVARKKVIVKRFDAIQNRGTIGILCSDKTGTLTMESCESIGFNHRFGGIELTN